MLNQESVRPHTVRRVSSQRASTLSASLRNALIVAAQVVLDSAVESGSDRLRVLGFGSQDDEDGLVLTSAKGTNPKKSALVVSLNSGRFISWIEAIRHGRSAAAARAAPAYWQASHACELQWSKDMVREHLASSSTMGDDEKARAVEAAPDVPTLLLNGAELELPRTLLCSHIARALGGEDVVVSHEDLDYIETFMACGLPLCSGRNPNQVGIRDAYVLMRSKIFFS
jgi:hypothetical protein